MLKWFILLFAGVVSFIDTALFAFTTQDLINLIEKKHIESIDALIPALPQNLRKNSTFITHSESLHSATPVSPRVILWSEPGQFVLTFNDGETRQRGNSKLEIMQTNAKTGKLHFIEIAFDKGMKVSEPTSCLQCHGQNPRPIWQEYPTWNNAYGSKDDFTTPEASDDFSKFIKTAITNPRYKSLFSDELNTYDRYPYRPNSDSKSTNLSTALTFRPNLRLGSLLTRLNARRIFSTLSSHPEYKSNRDRIIYELMNCGNSPSNTMPVILKKFGLSTADFDFRHRHDSPENANLDFRQSYFDGSATSIEYVVALLLAEKGYSSEVRLRGLDQKFELDSPRNNLDRSMFPVLDELGLWFPLPYKPTALSTKTQRREPFNISYKNQFERVCSSLSSGFDKPSSTVEENQDTPKSAIDRGRQVLENKCLSCHSFDTATPKRFYKKVKRRTSALAPTGYRMPYLGTPLSETERSDLLKYVKSIESKN